MVAFDVPRLAISVITLGALAIASFVPHDSVLQLRQDIGPANNVPGPCTSSCTALNNLDTTCPTHQPSCQCTNDVNNGFKSCWDCIFAQPGAAVPSLVEHTQLTLTDYELACGNAGFPLQALTLSAAQGLPTLSPTVAPGGGGGSSSTSSGQNPASSPTTPAASPNNSPDTTSSTTSPNASNTSSGAEELRPAAMGLLAVGGLAALLL